MKNVLLTTAALVAFASTASAMDLPLPGLALNTEVVAEHKVDASTSTLVATPELAYTPYVLDRLTVTAGMDVNVWDNAGGFTAMDTFDVKPEIAFGASFMATDSVELEALTSYDFEAAARGEITVRATFNF